MNHILEAILEIHAHRAALAKPAKEVSSNNGIQSQSHQNQDVPRQSIFMQHKLNPVIKWVVLPPFALFVLLWIVGILLCQIPKTRVHVRGELDRRNWVVRDDGSRVSYRVIMTSNQAFFFYQQEKQLQATDDERLVIEFEGYIHPIKMPWEKCEAVGIRRMIQLERLSTAKTTTRH